MSTININDIKNGYALFVNDTKAQGAIIQWFQGSRFHHAGAFVWCYDILYVFEANKHGMAFTEFEVYLDRMRKGKVELRVGFSGEENVSDEEMNRFCKKQTGKDYEKKNLVIHQGIRYIWKKLFGRTLWTGKNADEADNEFICGELLGYIRHYFFGDCPDWPEVAPADLLKRLEIREIKNG